MRAENYNPSPNLSFPRVTDHLAEVQLKASLSCIPLATGARLPRPRARSLLFNSTRWLSLITPRPGANIYVHHQTRFLMKIGKRLARVRDPRTSHSGPRKWCGGYLLAPSRSRWHPCGSSVFMLLLEIRKAEEDDGLEHHLGPLSPCGGQDTPLDERCARTLLVAILVPASARAPESCWRSLLDCLAGASTTLWWTRRKKSCFALVS